MILVLALVNFYADAGAEHARAEFLFHLQPCQSILGRGRDLFTNGAERLKVLRQGHGVA